METIDVPVTLLAVAAFLLPGFVSLGIAERTISKKQVRSNLEHTLQLLLYSTATYAIVGAGLWMIGGNPDVGGVVPQQDSSVGSVVAQIGLVTGTTVAMMGLLILSYRVDAFRLIKKWLKMRPDAPTAWDKAMAIDELLIVKTFLSDGQCVAGVLASESMAAYSVDGRDLFLEQRLDLDPDTGGPVIPAPEDTRGVWIDGAQIAFLELLRFPTEALVGNSIPSELPAVIR